MRVLVYPHETGIGGSQLNAVEIAAAVRDRGHEVLIVSRTGPLVDLIARLGLPHIPLDERASRRPSSRAAAHLTWLAQERRCDIVHGYEWPPGVEAFAGPRLRLGLPVVCTVMSMAVAPFLPRTMPLIVGADQIRNRAVSAGHRQVTLLEPPVDVRANAPDFAAGSFAQDLGVPPGVPLVVMVSRLTAELKLESLLASCDAAGQLASEGSPLRLVIAGDGEARPQVEQAAAAANARAGHTVVTLAGLLADPRPAYAAADVVLGMGGSSLRAMAFAKPVVVQGEYGFCELLTPQSADQLRRQGFFGLGPARHGRAEAAARLTAILRDLLGDPGRQADLGRYGRSLVLERFSLDRAARTQLEAYERAAALCAGVSRRDLTADAAMAAAGVTRHKVVRKWQRWRGTIAVDDFNAVPKIRG